MNETLRQQLDALYLQWPEAVGGPVAESEIADAERRLGVQFPPEYREFVRLYGGGVVGSEGIVGLREAPFLNESPPNVIEMTLQWRKELSELAGWLVFSVDGGGNPVGFALPDTRIWVLDLDFGGLIEEAPTFDAYLLALLGPG